MNGFEMAGNGGLTDARRPLLTRLPFPSGEEVIHDDSHALIATSIDSTLSQLGDESKTALLFHIRDQFHIQQDDFTNEPEALGRALARILGRGANILERIMVQHMEPFAPDTHTAQDFAMCMMTATRSELSTRDS